MRCVAAHSRAAAPPPSARVVECRMGSARLMVELLYRTTTPPGESSGIQPISYLALGRGNSADRQREYEIRAFGRTVASQTGVSSDMLLPEGFHCGVCPSRRSYPQVSASCQFPGNVLPGLPSGWCRLRFIDLHRPLGHRELIILPGRIRILPCGHRPDAGIEQPDVPGGNPVWRPDGWISTPRGVKVARFSRAEERR